MLPALARESDPSLAVRRHLSKCASCRAELETYRSIVASLATLEMRTIAPPSGLAAKLIAIPSEASRVDHFRSHVTRNRAAYAGGAAAAAAAAVVGAAGAFLWRSRERSSGRARTTNWGRFVAA